MYYWNLRHQMVAPKLYRNQYFPYSIFINIEEIMILYKNCGVVMKNKSWPYTNSPVPKLKWFRYSFNQNWLNETFTSKNARNPIRALLNVQAQDIMGVWPSDGGSIAGFWPERWVSIAGFRVFGRYVTKTAPKAPFLKIWKIFQKFYQTNVPKKN